MEDYRNILTEDEILTKIKKEYPQFPIISCDNYTNIIKSMFIRFPEDAEEIIAYIYKDNHGLSIPMECDRKIKSRIAKRIMLNCRGDEREVMRNIFTPNLDLLHSIKNIHLFCINCGLDPDEFVWGSLNCPIIIENERTFRRFDMYRNFNSHTSFAHAFTETDIYITRSQERFAKKVIIAGVILSLIGSIMFFCG
jgi:hypothetical protein